MTVDDVDCNLIIRNVQRDWTRQARFAMIYRKVNDAQSAEQLRNILMTRSYTTTIWRNSKGFCIENPYADPGMPKYLYMSQDDVDDPLICQTKNTKVMLVMAVNYWLD